ncbi:MAG: hypothetical protein ACLUYZ_01410 [Lachnospiraceae bacterium]
MCSVPHRQAHGQALHDEIAGTMAAAICEGKIHHRQAHPVLVRAKK